MPMKNYPLEEKLRHFITFEIAAQMARDEKSIKGERPQKPISDKYISRWKTRKFVPTFESLENFGEEAEGALEFGASAPFRLLADVDLSVTEIADLISVYRRDGGAQPYKFPTASPITDIDPWTERCGRDDSTTLARRGDIYGLFAILALIREAEAKGDKEGHLFHLRNAFQCLAPIGRFDWSRIDFGLLGTLVANLRDRVDTTQAKLGIYWNRIIQRFRDPFAIVDFRLDSIDARTLAPIDVASLGEMTYIVTASDVGEAPAWPLDENAFVDENYPAISDDVPFKVVRGISADRNLLLTLWNVLVLWGLPAETFSACLGIKPADTSGMFGHRAIHLNDWHRTRIGIVLELLHCLGNEVETLVDCDLILRRPRGELSGRNVLSMLRAGDVFGLGEALNLDAFHAAEKEEPCFAVVAGFYGSLKFGDSARGGVIPD